MTGLFELKRTTPPMVFNKYHLNAPDNAVYIGRGSDWGNPFVIGEAGNRREVIALYAEMVDEDEGLKKRIKKELKGQDLVCFCKPAPCHGDVLLAIANS